MWRVCACLRLTAVPPIGTWQSGFRPSTMISSISWIRCPGLVPFSTNSAAMTVPRRMGCCLANFTWQRGEFQEKHEGMSSQQINTQRQSQCVFSFPAVVEEPSAANGLENNWELEIIFALHLFQ